MANTNLNIVIDAQNKAGKAFSSINGSLDSLKTKMKKAGSIAKSVAKKATIAFTAIGGGIAFAVKEFAKFEQAEVAFETMLGSAEKAKEMMKELETFSAKTPFQFEGIAKAVRTLMAFGSEGGEARDQIKFLGDIASGAQVPIAEMAQIFGKVQTKGKAMTEEIMQMADRGIPIIQVLAKKFNVGTEAIFEMASQGELTAQVVQEALMSMTDEGGIFQDAMVKQSETIAGKWSTMKDNISLVLKTIGERFKGHAMFVIENITMLAGKVREFVQNWEANKERLVNSKFFTTLSDAFRKVADFFVMIWDGVLKEPLMELKDTLAEIGENEEFINILKKAGEYFAKTFIVILAVVITAFALLSVVLAKVIGIFAKVVEFITVNVGPALVFLGDLVKFVFFGILNVIKTVFATALNFIIDQVNFYIELVNGLVRKMQSIPKLGKAFKGISEITTFDKFQPELTDLNEFTNRPQAPVTNVNIQGNTFLDEQGAEKIGDLFLKEASLSSNLNF